MKPLAVFFYFCVLFTNISAIDELTKIDYYYINDYRDAIKVGIEPQNLKDVSPTCYEQLQNLSNATKLSMFDASSKGIYPGIAYSSPMDLGNYDQCINIEENGILGKYCLGTFINLTDILDADTQEGLVESICIPEGCSLMDIQIVYPLNGVLPVIFPSATCVTKETNKDFDAFDIVTLTFFIFILLIMIASTAYDVYCEKTEKKKFDLCIAFSVYTNTKKLLHIPLTANKEQIQIFHGLKFISMMWIIAGHGFVAFGSIPLLNTPKYQEMYHKRYSQYIGAAPLAVDTFFFISGFLLPYTYIKQYKGKPMVKQAMGVPMLYIHRYLRLTPALAVVYIVTCSLFRHLGDGPIWYSNAKGSADTCKKYAWSFFTYVQNYYNYDEVCLTQSWYLSADMQMFVISPLILIPTAYYITKNYRNVMLSLIAFSTVTVIVPIIIKFTNKEYSNPYDTHTRLCNYFIGFTFGVYMRVNIDKPFIFKKNANLYNLLLWIVSLVSMFVVCYLYNDVFIFKNGTYTSQTMFYGLMRPVWSLALVWIIYACYHDYGGIVNWILSRPNLQIGSRLSYCIYLTHGSIIAHYILQIRSKVFFSDFIAFYIWCGYFIMSLVISYIWTLAFESPIIILEKLVFGRGTQKRGQTQN